MNPIRKALPVLCDDVARLRDWLTVHRGPQPGTLRTNTDPTPPTLADGSAPAYWLGSEPLQPAAPAQHQQNDRNDPPSPHASTLPPYSLPSRHMSPPNPITGFYSDLMARHPTTDGQTLGLLVVLDQMGKPPILPRASIATRAGTQACSLLRKAGRVLRRWIRSLLGGISPRATPPPKRTVTTPKRLK